MAAIVNSGVNVVNNATLAITAATAGNLLAGFINQTSTPATNPPTMTGYTIIATSVNDGNANHNMFFFYKTAAGGETSIAPTPGTAGTIVQICYWEVSGWSGTYTVDGSILSASGTATATSYTSGAITTTGVNTILLMCLTTGNLLNGDAKAWTASNAAVPVLVGGTGTSREFVPGSYIPGATLSGVTVTANWTTSRVSGFMLVPIAGLAPGSSQGIPPSFL